jgi:hypothetical protein
METENLRTFTNKKEAASFLKNDCKSNLRFKIVDKRGRFWCKPVVPDGLSFSHNVLFEGCKTTHEVFVRNTTEDASLSVIAKEIEEEINRLYKIIDEYDFNLFNLSL